MVAFVCNINSSSHVDELFSRTNVIVWKMPHTSWKEFTCHNGSLASNVEEITNKFCEVIKVKKVKDVILLRGHAYEAEDLLSKKLSNRGVRMVHININRLNASDHDILEKLTAHFISLKLFLSTPKQTLLVSLSKDLAPTFVILKILQSEIFKAKIGYVLQGEPATWQAIIRRPTSYDVDMTLITAGLCSSLEGQLPLCYKPSVTENTFVESAVIAIQHNLFDMCFPTRTTTQVWDTLYSGSTAHFVLRSSFQKERTSEIPAKQFTPVLKVAVTEYPPFISLERINDTIRLKHCICKTIFEFITNHSELNFEFVETPDQQFGLWKNNQWTGSIRMLLDGKADLAPFMTITGPRTKVVDFTFPIGAEKITALVKMPAEPSRIFLFHYPFKLEVWICIIVAMFVMGVLLYLINFSSPFYRYYNGKKRNHCYFFRINNCLLSTYGSVVQQGSAFVPEAISARIIFMTWSLSVLVILATYSGNLIAILTFPEARWFIRNIHDLSKEKHISIIMQPGTAFVEEILEYSRKNDLKFEEDKRIVFSNWNKKIMDDVAEGSAVHLGDKFIISNYIIKEKLQTGFCRNTIIPHPVIESLMGVALRKGNVHKPVLNKYIFKLWESGLIKLWESEHYSMNQECFNVHLMLTGKKGLSLSDMQGVFFLLLCGLFLSLFIVVVEQWWTRYKNFRRQN
ncbi:glutamate receptor ionotropic, delta-2-like isoform X2 [Tachypleus tridentatus]